MNAHPSLSWAREVRDALLKPTADRARIDIFILDRDAFILLGPAELQGQRLTLDGLDVLADPPPGMTRWPDGRTYLTGVSRNRGSARSPAWTGGSWSASAPFRRSFDVTPVCRPVPNETRSSL